MLSRLNTQPGDDVRTVLKRITETIAWCSSRVQTAQPRTCLRSIELMPHALADGRKRVVGSVASKRYSALGRPKEEPARDLGGGRLLIYEPDVNLAHGLEESETLGYVDQDNTPPWDTWLAYIYEPKRDYLLSWVPGEFVSLVTEGIKVSPEEPFKWLDLLDLELTKLLKHYGIIG